MPSFSIENSKCVYFIWPCFCAVSRFFILTLCITQTNMYYTAEFFIVWSSFCLFTIQLSLLNLRKTCCKVLTWINNITHLISFNIFSVWRDQLMVLPMELLCSTTGATCETTVSFHHICFLQSIEKRSQGSWEVCFFENLSWLNSIFIKLVISSQKTSS